MDVKLLRKVKRQILKEPKQFLMEAFFARSSDYLDAPSRIPNCGTAACIGGWAIALKEKLNPDKADNATLYKEDAAQIALKLTVSQTIKLFYLENWPEKFLEDFNKKTNKKQWADRAKIAAARIEHFIRTKGKD